jgi:hypothetical protein
LLNLSVEVLGLEEIGHVLWLGVQVLGVVVVAIVSGADVVHLVGGTTFHAARLGLLAGEGNPENVVGVGRETGATNVLLVAGRVDNDGVLWRACVALVTVTFHLADHRVIRFILELNRFTYRDGWRPMASCRRCRYPASFREFRDAPDRWLARHQWERYRAEHRDRRGRPRS